MKSIRQVIAERVNDALVAVLGPGARDADPAVRAAQDERFGDYQSNCAMPLAKQTNRRPRDLAAALIERLSIEDLCEAPEIAGPGFINFRLHHRFVASALSEVPASTAPGGQRLGIDAVREPQVVIVDMSSPNLAKEMHVGHVRPTIIGDAVARILEFLGHDVHRVNHIGDWGTQFGMLIQHLRETAAPDRAGNLLLGDLEDFYIQAKARFDSDPEFARLARQAVVDLQSGDPQTREVWRAFCEESRRHCHDIYERLGIGDLEDRGESFYNDMLPQVVRELQEHGLAVVSDQAVCVFPKGFTGRDGAPLPLIIQKSDGGYTYATTDLAALKHRIRQLKAQRIIYVVGNQQKQHFEMLFSVLRETPWHRSDLQTVHLATGMLLNEAGAPFKTREGGTVKLKALLDEAVQRSRYFLLANEGDPAKKRGYDPALIDAMAQIIGIAAVKYFELSHNYATDYKFDWDAMLSLDGNTAPYMQYAYARIRSIARKADLTSDDWQDSGLILEHPSEQALAKQLLRCAEVIEQLGQELRPNLLTEYLYSLSKAFSTFYDRKTGVRVIGADAPQQRSRLKLCDLTGRTIKLGLGLLGIETLEQM